MLCFADIVLSLKRDGNFIVLSLKGDGNFIVVLYEKNSNVLVMGQPYLPNIGSP